LGSAAIETIGLSVDLSGKWDQGDDDDDDDMAGMEET
jgi:hypothetical protein